RHRIRLAARTHESGAVLVEVEDDGAGIPPEVMPRLFTPFFSTKPVGVGTGLGLSICHRIITGLGGKIAVTSRAGEGTTFRILLPATTLPIVERPSPGGLATSAGPGGLILVVDDDPLVGAALRRALGGEHQVTVASH